MLRHYVIDGHNIVIDSSFSLGISVPSMAVTERMTRGSSVPAMAAGLAALDVLDQVLTAIENR
jgi:hypothetical protein